MKGSLVEATGQSIVNSLLFRCLSAVVILFLAIADKGLAAEPLSAPQNVQASDGVDINWIRITFDPVPGADSYQISTAPSPDGPWQYFDSLFFVEEPLYFSHYLEFLEPQYYRVRAADAYGQYSAWSEIDLGYSYSPPPREISVSRGGFQGSTPMAWSTTENAKEYEIFRGDTEVFEDALYLAATTDTAFVDLSGEPGVEYYYFVRAKNGGAVSYPSEGIRGWSTRGLPFRPDALIGEKLRSMRGNNVYRSSRKQEITPEIRSRRRGVYIVQFENDGETLDLFHMKGRNGNRHFRLRYFEPRYGTNVSSKVTSRGVAGFIPPNRSFFLIVVAIPEKSARSKRVRMNISATVKSLYDDRLSDQVRARISTERPKISIAPVPDRIRGI